MYRIGSIVAFCISLSIVSAQDFNINYVFPIETSHSYVTFETTYMGYAKVRGSFGNHYGSIYYNPEDLSQTSITFQIDVTSIDTNNDWRDGDLQSGNWFLAEEYPHIHFSSTSVKTMGEELEVTGDLTIKETTKTIHFVIPKPLDLKEDIRGDHQVIFTGSYTLNRKEYGVMGKNWSQVKEGIAALSDEVTIEFSLLGKQLKESNFKNFLRNEEQPPGAIYVAYQSGGVNGAIEKFDQFHAKEETDARAMNMVAFMLSLQEKNEDALSLLQHNLTAFPESSELHGLLGKVHAKTGNMKEARQYYRKALDLDATNMGAKEILKHIDQ